MTDRNTFRFKQFTVSQENSAMKVGTDGVMLGAWFNCAHASRILDIGTGTGLIALMLAQRSNALVDAVDIDQGAINDAEFNFGNSPWNDRLTAVCANIVHYADTFEQKYDAIACNPPFFSNSLKPAIEQRSLARHTETLTTTGLLSCVVKLMAPTGVFGVVIPSDQENEFRLEAKHMGLYPLRIARVKHNEKKPYKRVLMEFSFSKHQIKEYILTVETGVRHVYSSEYQKLLAPFYLNL